MSSPTQRVTYREHAPSALLAPYVECYWTSATPDGFSSTPHRVLPDGCADILFSLAPDRDDRLFVGTMTRALVHERRANERWVAIRFRPGGAYPFVGGSLADFTDHVVPLADVGVDGLRTHDTLRAAGGVAQQVAAVEEWLISGLYEAPDPVVARAVACIEASAGRITVGELSERLGISRQHLARRMGAGIGIGPKKLARVRRMQALVGAMRASGKSAGLDAALDAGYFDQSHMIGELRRLTGLTPAELLAGR